MAVYINTNRDLNCKNPFEVKLYNKKRPLYELRVAQIYETFS